MSRLHRIRSEKWIKRLSRERRHRRPALHLGQHPLDRVIDQLYRQWQSGDAVLPVLQDAVMERFHEELKAMPPPLPGEYTVLDILLLRYCIRTNYVRSSVMEPLRNTKPFPIVVGVLRNTESFHYAPHDEETFANLGLIPLPQH